MPRRGARGPSDPQASSRGTPTRSCRAASSRGDGARKGGTPRGRRADAKTAAPVTVARSACLIGLAGRNAGGAKQPAPPAAGTKTPSVAHTCRCTWRFRAEPKRCTKEGPAGAVGKGLGRRGGAARRRGRRPAVWGDHGDRRRCGDLHRAHAARGTRAEGVAAVSPLDHGPRHRRRHPRPSPRSRCSPGLCSRGSSHEPAPRPRRPTRCRCRAA